MARCSHEEGIWRCGASVKEGQQLCYHHDPMLAEKRAEVRNRVRTTRAECSNRVRKQGVDHTVSALRLGRLLSGFLKGRTVNDVSYDPLTMTLFLSVKLYEQRELALAFSAANYETHLHVLLEERNVDWGEQTDATGMDTLIEEHYEYE